MSSKKEMSERISKLLTENTPKADKAIIRALQVLYSRQTADEQRSNETRRRNAMGFTPADAFMGTQHATFFERRGFLTRKQLDYWMVKNRAGIPRIVKYAGQLANVALEKEKLKELQNENAQRELITE